MEPPWTHYGLITSSSACLSYSAPSSKFCYGMYEVKIGGLFPCTSGYSQYINLLRHC